MNLKFKKSLYSKFIVLLVILLNIGFTTGTMYISLHGYTVPDTLIVSWFSFTTVELWALARIKKEKVKNGGNEDGQRNVYEDSSRSNLNP